MPAREMGKHIQEVRLETIRKIVLEMIGDFSEVYRWTRVKEVPKARRRMGEERKDWQDEIRRGPKRGEWR